MEQYLYFEMYATYLFIITIIQASVIISAMYYKSQGSKLHKEKSHSLVQVDYIVLRPLQGEYYKNMFPHSHTGSMLSGKCVFYFILRDCSRC